jgi:glycosyltransferase involved in cell wall biosynthesis
MAERIRLSICVPSRNRQRYFQQTIVDLLDSARTDVEFVFADNSDDPSLMDGFVAGLVDPRIVYLPSAPEALTMPDNWERALKAASGDWVVFIGDDDYVDPDLVSLIDAVSLRAVNVDVIGWSRLTFKWPDFRAHPGNMCIQLGNRAATFSRQQVIDTLFRWRRASHVPSSPFSIYHGALRRSLIDRFLTLYGRMFEHDVVDYECACKVAVNAGHIVYLERPLSVLGVCPSSNSAAANDYQQSAANYRALVKAQGRGEEGSFWMGDFPFGSHLGVAGCIIAVQHWFKEKYDFPVDGWQESFIGALERECANATSEKTFSLQADACRRALSRYRNGQYLDQFRPVYTVRDKVAAFTGMAGNTLFIDEAAAQTPALAQRLAGQIVDAAENIQFELRDHSGPLPADVNQFRKRLAS